MIAGLCAAAGCFSAGCREQVGETESGDSDGTDSPHGDEGGPQGSYQLGGQVDGAGGDSGSENCDPKAITLRALVRDFKAGTEEDGHPDFETFGGAEPTLGLVEVELGKKRKPIYTGLCSKPGITETCPNNQQMTTKENFDMWYGASGDDAPSFEVLLSLASHAKTISFQAGEFFPLDGVGHGNQGRDHNFHFTTEVHTEFVYTGGEVFSFTGDDDVWIFINGKLAVDLGGLHGESTGTVDLDAMAETLGLTVGQSYPFDLFHAERHTENSRFRIDTNLVFTKCGLAPQSAP